MIVALADIIDKMFLVWQQVRKPLLTGLLLLYLTGDVIAAAPWSEFREAFDKKLKPAFNFWGMSNNYGVFSPDPLMVNRQYRAVLTFADGTKKIWDFHSQADWQGDEMVLQRL